MSSEIMSAGLGAISASKDTLILSSNMKKEEQKIGKIENLGCELKENADICKDLIKEISKKSGDNEDVNDCLKSDVELSSNEQLQKDDKDDKSLSNEKQPLQGSIDLSAVEESKEAQVQIMSLSVISPGRPDVVLPIPFPATTSKTTLFTLKEGSKYRIKFLFIVSNNIVKNLTYTYMVWKAGIRVQQTKKIIGTFSPHQEPYSFELEEGTTPSGFFARGPFFVRSKFVDDDGNCYLDTTYYFDIRKDWGARDKC